MAFHLPKSPARARLPAMVLVLGVCSSCASTYQPPDWTQVPQTSGVDRSTSLSDLTADQSEALCVWTARVFGGFGKRYDCPPRSCEHRSQECWVRQHFSMATREQCRHFTAVSKEKCKATVAENEHCIVRISSNLCGRDWASDPECRSLFSCWRRE